MRKWLLVVPGRFKLDIGKNIMEEVIWHWDRLPREGLELPTLRVFKGHVDGCGAE